MDYYVSPENFRTRLESNIARENERLRSADPESPYFQIIDGARKINIPDEGALILQQDGSRISPSMSLYELRTGFLQSMAENGYGDAESLWEGFFQDNFQRLEGELIKNQEVSKEIERIQDPEIALSRISPCICQTSRNRDLLNTIPHREIYDLSIYYRIDLNFMKDPETRANVIVRDHMMMQWNIRSDDPITEETLYARAYENEQKETRIQDMDDIIMDITMDIPQNMQEVPAEERPYTMPEAEYGKMYVVTNRMKYYGAAGAMMGIAMEEFVGQKVMDFYILPSSIHEVILIGADGMFQPEDLARFVRTVNRTEVSPEERLSNSVYFYNHYTRSIQMAYDAEGARQRYQAQANSRSYMTGQQLPRRGR